MKERYKNYLMATLVVVIIFLITNKESFYNIKEEALAEKQVYYRQTYPETKPEKISKSNLNKPPGGANTNVNQLNYDILFKDILVNSEKRNILKYPNPNKYSVLLNLNINDIYKAEIIEVYVPAATDDTVNIPISGNEIYFSYTNGALSTTGYAFIQAGTYMSPDSVAMELCRQISIVLTAAGFTLSATVGIKVIYNKNLNRYIFIDKNYTAQGTITIYPENGYIINSNLTVQNSIASYIMLNYSGPVIYPPYTSGPKFINSNDGILFVDNATNYGVYTNSLGNVVQVPTTVEPQFSNCIISDVVLTNDKLYLSLGKLNGTTCNIISNENQDSEGNVPMIFCQVPNNTCISSASVKTSLNQPNTFTAIQFYNPIINKLNKLDIAWYTDNGSLVRILDHCFTLRVYYLQKRLETTDISYQVL